MIAEPTGWYAPLFEPDEVRRLLTQVRCVSDPCPVSPARGPPDWPESLDFPGGPRPHAPRRSMGSGTTKGSGPTGTPESGLRAPRGGSVLVMQRFGYDLRTNLHLHGLFLDGAYGEDEHGARRFARAAAPSPDDVEAILARIVTRARAWLDARDGEGALDDDELALAQSHHASSRASGAEAHRPDDDLLEQGRLVLLPTRRKARIDGFDLDAEVAVHEHERDRLEYLCRYVLRPPLALDRLKILADDLVCIELKHPWRDGTTCAGSRCERGFVPRSARVSVVGGVG